jgi:hypothetical protein
MVTMVFPTREGRDKYRDELQKDNPHMRFILAEASSSEYEGWDEEFLLSFYPPTLSGDR